MRRPNPLPLLCRVLGITGLLLVVESLWVGPVIDCQRASLVNCRLHALLAPYLPSAGAYIGLCALAAVLLLGLGWRLRRRLPEGERA